MGERGVQFLKNARILEILCNEKEKAAIAFLLGNSSGDQGILQLRKTGFPRSLEDFQRIISSSEFLDKDILAISTDLNEIHSQLFYPSSDKLIARFRTHQRVLIQETSENYRNITLPYIEAHQLNWVHNLLEKRSGHDQIILDISDPQDGFVLINDLQWNGKDLGTLHCLAITYRRNIKSIRDLTADDLPMLESLREKCLEHIWCRYGLRKDQMKVFFHYQPTFYHLHIHFVNVHATRASLSDVMLNDVINNIQLMGDYYQRATMTISMKTADPLYKLLKEAN